jgi:hypothetical protein
MCAFREQNSVHETETGENAEFCTRNAILQNPIHTRDEQLVVFVLVHASSAPDRPPRVQLTGQIYLTPTPAGLPSELKQLIRYTASGKLSIKLSFCQ